jgi:flagellar biogenesis protein FliO
MDLGRVTLALTAVIALILFLRWGSRKILAIPAAGTSPHVMRVVARSPIAPKQNVLLLRVGQRLVIVGDSGGRLSALGQITDADEIATIVGQAKSNATSPPANFGGMLRRLSRRFRGMEPGEIAEDEAGDIEETDSRQERQSLLGGLDAREADAAAQKSAIDASETKVGFDDAAAEAAVEAARRDVAALREKLREVSQRMAVGSGTAEAAKDSPAPPATGTA